MGSPYDSQYHGTYNDAFGFRPGIDTALSGRFYALLRDDEPGCFEFFCGGDLFEFVDIDLGNAIIDPFGIFEIDIKLFNESLSAQFLGQINATGQLDWEIKLVTAFGFQDVIVDAVGMTIRSRQPWRCWAPGSSVWASRRAGAGRPDRLSEGFGTARAPPLHGGAGGRRSFFGVRLRPSEPSKPSPSPISVGSGTA